MLNIQCCFAGVKQFTLIWDLYYPLSGTCLKSVVMADNDYCFALYYLCSTTMSFLLLLITVTEMQCRYICRAVIVI